MKKILCIVLALIMVLSLCACGGKDEEGLTITEGVLTVATSPDYAPYEFYALDAEGNPTLAGFDMALAQYIADYLGLELEVVPMNFNGILGEMATGNADLAIAGLSPDPDISWSVQGDGMSDEALAWLDAKLDKEDPDGTKVIFLNCHYPIDGRNTASIRQAILITQFLLNRNTISVYKLSPRLSPKLSPDIGLSYHAQRP